MFFMLIFKKELILKPLKTTVSPAGCELLTLYIFTNRFLSCSVPESEPLTSFIQQHANFFSHYFAITLHFINQPTSKVFPSYFILGFIKQKTKSIFLKKQNQFRFTFFLYFLMNFNMVVIVI